MSLPCIPPELGFGFHDSPEFLSRMEELWNLHTSMASSLSPHASKPILQLHLVYESADPSHVSCVCLAVHPTPWSSHTQFPLFGHSFVPTP